MPFYCTHYQGLAVYMTNVFWHRCILKFHSMLLFTNFCLQLCMSQFEIVVFIIKDKSLCYAMSLLVDEYRKKYYTDFYT